MSSLSGKKVLITGGGGFIGSHLVKRLIELKAQVDIIDIATTVPWRLKNIFNEIGFFSADISDYEALYNVINQSKPEYIFHLAAYGVNYNNNDYKKALDTNINGIVNIIMTAKEAGCKRIVNIGSCAEYGDKRNKICEEDFLEPVNIYGSTKAAATLIAHQLASEKGVDIITIRPFGIFGEGEERHKIFCHSILTLLKNKDLELTSCKQYRNYCYIGDIINALILAAQADYVKNEIFNIGVEENYPLKYYIKLIHSTLGSSGRLLFGKLDNRKQELWSPKPNINKIKNVLGWNPKMSLEEGIIQTIAWYKENVHHYT